MLPTLEHAYLVHSHTGRLASSSSAAASEPVMAAASIPEGDETGDAARARTAIAYIAVSG